MGKKRHSASEPIPFPVKASLISGTRFAEVVPQARDELREIARKTKRQPYIRSAFFHGDKVFLTHFWPHLNQKPVTEQIRRLKLLPCGIELIRKSRNKPISKVNVDRKSEMLHRFAGVTKGGILFYVQIKESRKTGRKELMSIFSPH